MTHPAIKTPAQLRAEAMTLLEAADTAEDQVTQVGLKAMTPDDIETARLAGRLDSLLGRK